MDLDRFLGDFVKTRSSYRLTPEDRKTITHEGVRQFIFNKLSSSKYRASAISPDYKQKVIDKIDLLVNHDAPIHITLPFGATKNPYLLTAPGIDWGEVFAICLLRNYLSPIAAGYINGVLLEFVSVGVFEERVNRIPQKEIDLYDKQFERLLTFFKEYLPKGMQISYTRVSDDIAKKEINRLLELKIIELRKDWLKQPREVREYKILRAKRNSLFDPKSKNLEELLLDSALGHDAFCSECWTTKAAPWDEKDMITLGYTYTPGWAIHVRSAPGSTINFWSGMGVLEKRGERFLPTVLSLSQLNTAKNRIRREKVKVFGKAFPTLQEIPLLV